MVSQVQAYGLVVSVHMSVQVVVPLTACWIRMDVIPAVELPVAVTLTAPVR